MTAMNPYHTQESTAIAQRTVVAQVMARLKDLIASGEYRPGDRLPTEQELATAFGVGRSSIREAIKVFQHLGVIEARAAKGTFLRDRANISSEAITWALLLGDDDLSDVLELREAVESVCMGRLTSGLAVESREALATLDALDEVVAGMRTAAEDRDIAALVEADYRFHGLIVEAGRNNLFRSIYSSMHAFLSDEIRSTYDEMDDLREVADDHADIVAVLRQGDADASTERHIDHFQRTRRLLRVGERDRARAR